MGIRAFPIRLPPIGIQLVDHSAKALCYEKNERPTLLLQHGLYHSENYHEFISYLFSIAPQNDGYYRTGWLLSLKASAVRVKFGQIYSKRWDNRLSSGSVVIIITFVLISLPILPSLPPPPHLEQISRISLVPRTTRAPSRPTTARPAQDGT